MMFKDKVAIITGAGRGIGQEIALRFSQEGATTVIVDIAGETAAAVCKEIVDAGREAISVSADLSKEDAVRKMVETTIDKYGRIDILVNNAGISPKKEGRRPNLTEISPEEWNEVITVNLGSVFLCTKTVLPYMMKQKSGRIISISSSSALDGGFLAGPHYVASKGAISALTMNLVREVAPYGITVNAVAPGRTQTPMALLTSNEKNKEAMQRIPLGRFATPEDIANAVLFLASENSGYITGTTLNVTGGSVAR